MPFVSPVDTYFAYVVQQMATLKATVSINGNLVPQPFGGVVNARDWPQSPVVEGALYLLVLTQNPNNKGMPSQAQMGYEYFCQWVWLLLGTDIQASQLVQNRADRFRQEMQIVENLRQASYPGWTRKMDVSVDTNGNLSFVPSSSVVPVNALEMITWTNLRFMPKPDNEKSGVSYGAAAVEIHGYSDVSALVA